MATAGLIPFAATFGKMNEWNGATSRTFFCTPTRKRVSNSAALKTEYRKSQANGVELVHESILSHYTYFGGLLARAPCGRIGSYPEAYSLQVMGLQPTCV